MSDFHQAFAQALLAQDLPGDGPLAAITAQFGFAIYRNTVLKGCIDALEANFPTVARLVGSDWFRSAALAYVRKQPPSDGRLLAYGDDGFPAFVQSLPTAAALDYLAAVAQLDALWRACHVAGDAPVLAANVLAGLAPDVLAGCMLWPHPATRWAWFPDAPVATLWLREREQRQQPQELPATGDGLLLTRVHGAVQAALLPRAGCALLDACAAGEPLGAAADLALAADPAADLAGTLRQLLQAGAFTTLPPENLP